MRYSATMRITLGILTAAHDADLISQCVTEYRPPPLHTSGFLIRLRFPPKGFLKSFH
jgi:hypothetical protein